MKDQTRKLSQSWPSAQLRSSSLAELLAQIGIFAAQLFGKLLAKALVLFLQRDQVV